MRWEANASSEQNLKQYYEIYVLEISTNKKEKRKKKKRYRYANTTRIESESVRDQKTHEKWFLGSMDLQRLARY